MIARLFEHRSGRIIATCRVVFAAVFFGALLVQPAGPPHPDDPGFQFLGAYLVLAILLLVVAMRSWWWDHRLAWPMLAVDILAFLAAVFLTEGSNSDFTSPFLAIFAFVMLAATIRWNWRVTAATGLAVTTLYVLVGLGMSAARIDFDTLRFGRRIAYMLVLSLILIWFGLQRREQHIGRFRELPNPAARLLPPLDDALAFAIQQAGARSGAIAWSDSEEPAIELRTHHLPAHPKKLGPETLLRDGAEEKSARIFSADRKRSLQASSAGRPEPVQAQLSEPLADMLGIGEALAIPIAGGTGSGEIVLSGISGLCEDHVMIGTLIARELQAALDRHATLTLLHESAVARSREALARDLHDSVAQSLAGAALRLEGLRKSIRAGHDADAEIAQVKDALRTEQKQVRAMIERLRYNDSSGESVDLTESAQRLCADLSGSWGVAIPLQSPAPISAPVTLEHEIDHLLREAVANAVRHGGAQEVAVTLREADGKVIVEIIDDGSGFGEAAGPDAPRSIRERTQRHGGSFAVRTGDWGTQLTISLPLGDAV